MKEKVPDLGRAGGPIWWHHHGMKMKVAARGLCNDCLLLQGSAAELLIKKLHNRWLLTWKVIQGPDSAVSGTTTFCDETLLDAFVKNNHETPKHSQWLIDRFGGSAACQGCFIRFDKWLNIPGPGTGNDGDPNISIELDEEMAKAVLELVYNNR